MKLYFAERNLDKCTHCNSCGEIVACSSREVGYVPGCIGCGACYLACPYEAIGLKEQTLEG